MQPGVGPTRRQQLVVHDQLSARAEPDLATVALEQVDDDVEREQALVLARKKMVTMSRLDEPTQTRRLAGLLARKGYSGELVWSVIRQVQEEAS